LTIEQVILRLETFEIFADLAAAIIIPVNLIKEVKTKLFMILPTLSGQIGRIAYELEDICQVTGNIEPLHVEAANLTEEAMIILEEAKVTVEARAKEIFPEIQQSQVSSQSQELEPA
jgi:division protein CdvB (Snf7/Vps24/ESCRT-III family)